MKVNGQPCKLVVHYMVAGRPVFVATQRVLDLGLVRADLAELVWAEAMGHGSREVSRSQQIPFDPSTWPKDHRHSTGSVVVNGSRYQGPMFRGESTSTVAVDLGDVLVAITGDADQLGNMTLFVS